MYLGLHFKHHFEMIPKGLERVHVFAFSRLTPFLFLCFDSPFSLLFDSFIVKTKTKISMYIQTFCYKYTLSWSRYRCLFHGLWR